MINVDFYTIATCTKLLQNDSENKGFENIARNGKIPASSILSFSHDVFLPITKK